MAIRLEPSEGSNGDWIASGCAGAAIGSGSRATMMDVIRHGGGTFMLVTASVQVVLFTLAAAMSSRLAFGSGGTDSQPRAWPP